MAIIALGKGVYTVIKEAGSLRNFGRYLYGFIRNGPEGTKVGKASADFVDFLKELTGIPGVIENCT